MSMFGKDKKDEPTPASEPDKNAELPDGVKPPPEITLPTPDGFAKSNQQEQVNAARAKKERAERKKKKRRHPTDPYKKMSDKKGCGCAGCGCLTLLVLILVPLGALGWLMAPVAEFEQVIGESTVMTVTEGPADKTLYVANTIEYEAPETSSEIAFGGNEVTLSGFFSEKVYVRAYKVTLTPESIFLKDLDIYAVEFENNSQQIEGELTGSIATQSTE